jgi:AraC family transcriptional regulator of adaptative response/methylated-DNA-[protein]-cysteine methyltransferase
MTVHEMWRAVLGRDRRADGTFVYAVKTTGVYCRPSCGARRPRRENVAFHQSCQSAARAGFRPCRRCRPEQSAEADSRLTAVAVACRFIERSASVPTLDTLARAAGMSRFHFHRVFRAVVGITPRAYATAYRSGRMREELRRRTTVTEAIYAAGFNSNSRFYDAAGRELGMTPTTFRAGGAGMAIRFAVADCWLGRLLVAATDKGICSVMFGDDEEPLEQGLRDRFPRAEIRPAPRSFGQLVARVVRLVESPARVIPLPLDVQGTAFERRVWQALRAIPPGETATYGEIARRVGAPRAVRGVARACAANPVAVAIPCHRVVRSDGSLAGYRWGLERKRALLEREPA